MLWKRDEDFQRGLNSEGEHKLKDKGTVGGRGNYMPSGFHHVALVCKNMNETVKFYEEALGLKLRALFPMHGVPGAKHCFLEGGNGCEISFVEFSKPMKGQPGVSYPENPAGESPIGTHHHMAYRAETLEQLYNLRSQVKSTGTIVSPVLHHDFCLSFYFEDPNGINLEVCHTIEDYSLEKYQTELLTTTVKDTDDDHNFLDMIKKASIYHKQHIKSKL